MKTLVRIALLVALGGGMALAQSMPQKSPAGTPPTFPQSGQQPQTPPDQTQPGTQPSTPPDQTPQGSQQPSTAPDQTPQQQPSTSDTGTKPQNDSSAGMASSPNDLQNSIETAIKQDPNLASSNVQVKVTDKNIELSGDVSSKDQKKAAEKIAKDNAGGRKVKDHIKVASNSNNNPNDQSKNPGTYPKQ
jgi:hypothetical protein